MQYVHHVVMTTDKRFINPGGLRYVQFKGSYKVRSTLPVGYRCKTIGRKYHRQGATWKIVGSMNASELRVKGANPLRVAVVISRAFARIGPSIFFRKPADGEDLRSAVRTVTNVGLNQSKVAAIHNWFFRHWFIGARQQNDESVGGSLSGIFR